MSTVHHTKLQINVSVIILSLSEFYYQIDAIEPLCINVLIKNILKAARFIHLLFMAELKKRLATPMLNYKQNEL